MLRDNPAVLLSWLQQEGATWFQRLDYSKVEPQRTFPALSSHNVDSRPDIVIELGYAGQKEMIFIESKVGSTAGHTQLERYLDHLAAQRAVGMDRATLLFVTQRFEADYLAIFCRPGKCPVGVDFRQTRWYKFHRLLRTTLCKDNSLAEQLALFMEENQMNLHNRFRTVDIAGLENFLTAKALMDETLVGKVEGKCWTNALPVTKHTKAMKQLLEQNRYVLIS